MFAIFYEDDHLAEKIPNDVTAFIAKQWEPVYRGPLFLKKSWTKTLSAQGATQTEQTNMYFNHKPE